MSHVPDVRASNIQETRNEAYFVEVSSFSRSGASGAQEISREQFQRFSLESQLDQ